MTTPDATVFVVEDDASNRDSLQRLLESAGLRTQTFRSAEQFLTSDKALDAPSCLVLDVRLPGLSGLDLQRELTRTGLNLPVIFITAYGDIEMSVEAMKRGAFEFVTKPFRPQGLLEVVRQAIARDQAAWQARAEMLELRRRLDSLTPRERQVMGLVAAGLLNKQIAAELGTREITIKLHRAQLMRKMKATSLPDLVRMADRLQIPPTGE
jgi:FixJ family two-component response regulator